ncbi:MAG: HPr(Ser) kinase/phosphatase [Gammaproteobacteria bacterium]|jgi:HPr kinase/phosphorylase
MQSSLTVKELVELTATTLGLSWLAGHAGAQRELSRGNDVSSATLVGHLNLVRPYCVQILGQAECQYLRELTEQQKEDVLSRLFKAEPFCILVADGLPAAPDLLTHADHSGLALLESALPSQKLVENLRYLLAHQLAKRITVHGVFLEVMGAGILLTGDSGVGKSELALELITRGHRLIADDAVEFAHVAPNTLEGTCPRMLQNFLEVRGLGIVNVRALFGDSAVKLRKNLRLIIQLQPMHPEQMRATDRLHGLRRRRPILGVAMPEITLPVAPGRNMAVLVECTVRNHLLRIKGYDATRDFQESQRRAIEEDQSQKPA